ncbi:MAG: hypothetical protein GX638_18355 [Crenarchaeota archaeon]|nr:hypothetical protein [Thermoproteota archaeon]
MKVSRHLIESDRLANMAIYNDMSEKQRIKTWKRYFRQRKLWERDVRSSHPISLFKHR